MIPVVKTGHWSLLACRMEFKLLWGHSRAFKVMPLSLKLQSYFPLSSWPVLPSSLAKHSWTAKCHAFVISSCCPESSLPLFHLFLLVPQSNASVISPGSLPYTHPYPRLILMPLLYASTALSVLTSIIALITLYCNSDFVCLFSPTWTWIQEQEPSYMHLCITST